MYEIPMNEVSKAFVECWQNAGRHLQEQGQGSINWLRAHLHPPMLEHLSFRLGNQLFFICFDAEGVAPFTAATGTALCTIADGCRGHACVMPLRRTPHGWLPAIAGWGLLDFKTNHPINPLDFVTEEKIEMSDWELQDLAVQVVRDQIAKQGRALMSWQGDPRVDPSMWFVGNEGPEWVVVRVARYPHTDPRAPGNWAQIAEGCARISKIGHFASVTVANADDWFDPTTGSPLPLWRGHRMNVNYEGLTPAPR